MPYFVGLDASKRTTHICVIDRDGAVVDEGVVETSPKAIASFLRGQRRRYVRVGMEAWSIAAWLYDGLSKAGLPIVSIEARSAHAFLKANRNKTDRNDARAIAQLMRLGRYRVVHMKSLASQHVRALLTTRRLLVDKAGDIENAVRSLLLGAGLKLEHLRRRTFEARVRQLVEGSGLLRSLVESLLSVRAAIRLEKASIDKALSALAHADPVCVRLMTAPGVGELTALHFRSAVDEPRRFSKSRSVAAHFGLTPRIWQSGETAVRGRITCWGDAQVRRALVLSAWTYLKKSTRRSWLHDWADQIAARRGRGKAMVAVARRLATVLHRMWLSETDFRVNAQA
jgi:transposase